MAQRKAILKVGKTYKNKYGGEYICIDGDVKTETFILKNTKSRWTLKAHTITMYEDGTIEWDYSTGGHFEE